jgi:uncharacterized delta-60 repeat protein
MSIVAISSSVYAASDSIDPTFFTALNTGVDHEDDWAMALAVQPDGKILVGGYLTKVNGVARNGIARLNPDGTLDTTFNPGSGTNDGILALALQPDGKIVIGGYFTQVNGVSRKHIARLNADGSLDPSFDVSTGPNDWVMALAVQPDGKVLVGGLFWAVNDIRRDHIARLNADGSLDTTFDPGRGTNDWVMAMVMQPDGKVLVGGYFTVVNGVSRTFIARLHMDGTLDPTFDPGNSADVGVGVIALAAQPDGKTVIGGAFTTVGGVPRNRIARLNTDGSLDTTFNPGSGANDWVKSLAVQPDGKIIIGGQFTTMNDIPRNYITRLNGDGTLDATFASGSGADSIVWSVKVQADGKVLLGGQFSKVNGVRRDRIARLQGVPDAHSGPRIFLSPAVTTIAPNQTFQLDMRIDTATATADTIDAYLTFDPAALEVIDAAGNPATSITANPAVVDNATYNSVDPTTGQIDFSASQYSSPYLTGVATVATIRFRAKALIGTTPVRFVQQGVRRSDLFQGGAGLQATVEHASVEIYALSATDAAARSPEPVQAQIGAQPRFAVRPAIQQTPVGKVTPLDLWADLGTTTAATVDFYLKVDPALVEIVDATGQPATRLEIRRMPGASVTSNRVDRATGELRFSVSRLRIPVTSETLPIATLYLRAKQPFKSLPISLDATGQSFAHIFRPGQNLHALTTGSIVTTNNVYRVHLPRTSR